MSAEAESRLFDSLRVAIASRELAQQARETERQNVARFIHEARRQNWSWHSIGEKLEISDNAVRGYYKRNRMKLRA